MKIIYNKILPIKGFAAINLFGILFARKESKPLSIYTMNHEIIHTKQMKETLYVFFYVWYLIEWIIKLFKYKSFNTAYYNISFEREAYKNMYNLRYLDTRKKYSFLK